MRRQKKWISMCNEIKEKITELLCSFTIISHDQIIYVGPVAINKGKYWKFSKFRSFKRILMEEILRIQKI